MVQRSRARDRITRGAEAAIELLAGFPSQATANMADSLHQRDLRERQIEVLEEKHAQENAERRSNAS